MNYLKDTIKGIYTIVNPQKYFGTKNPIFKSSWEAKLFYVMDINPHIIKWGYECQEVPYFNPVKGKYTVYYPDIFCHVMQTSGQVKQFLIEIKPYKMCIPPTPPKTPKKLTPNSLKKYENAQRRYLVDNENYKINVEKWKTAEAWCHRHNITWMLLNEKNTPLFLK